MAKITIGIGLLLIVLGWGGYFAGGRVSMTALIPAFFGIPIALFGMVALKENLRMHAMHGAVLFGLLGFIGALVRPIKAMMGESGFELTLATGSQLAMSAICLVFVILCVKSFIDARRSKDVD